MVTLRVGNKYITVEGADEDALIVLDRATSAKDPQAKWSMAFKRGFTDDRFHLMKGDIFPTGLLFQACSALEKADIEWDVSVEANILEGVEPDYPATIELRDYQAEAVKHALSCARGIINVPVNGGKSYIGMAIVGTYIAQCQSKRALFLVKRAEGVKQMYEHFVTHFGEDYVSVEPVDPSNVVVMTYTKAARRDLEEFDLVLCDEVQVVGAKTIFKTAVSATNAYNVFGLSGTPLDREDGKNIYIKAATGEVIFDGINHDILIADGFSADADIVMYRVDGDHFTGNQWNEVEKLGISENAARNAEIVEIAREAESRGMKTLIQIRRIEHGRELVKVFHSYGVAAEFTHGGQSPQKRGKIFEEYRDAKEGVMIASGIWDDSISIPDIRVLINAAGLKSKIATKQKLGRGMRNPDGTKKLLMIDFFDSHHYILKRHSVRRKENYEAEGFDVRDCISIGEIFDGGSD